jgi:protein gp37
MADTSIEWTDAREPGCGLHRDFPGCTNCYAMRRRRLDAMGMKISRAGAQGGKRGLDRQAQARSRRFDIPAGWKTRRLP